LLELLDADSRRPADLAVTHNLALTPGFRFSPHSTAVGVGIGFNRKQGGTLHSTTTECSAAA
jgi:hypothetical protein